jgi:hypothetical protein
MGNEDRHARMSSPMVEHARKDRTCLNEDDEPCLGYCLRKYGVSTTISRNAWDSRHTTCGLAEFRDVMVVILSERNALTRNNADASKRCLC